MAAQDLLGLGELRFASELRRPLQIEHDRRVLEETRAALHLLGEFGFEAGIAQHSGAHHHDGEDCALHEIARHPKYATRPRRFETLRVNPKSCPSQPVLPRVARRFRISQSGALGAGNDAAATDRATQSRRDFRTVVLDAGGVEAGKGGVESWGVHGVGGAVVAV